MINRKYILQLFSLMLICAFFSCGRNNENADYQTIQNIIEARLSNWIKFSLSLDPAFSLSKFKLDNVKVVKAELEYPFTKNIINKLDSVYHYSYSPDRTKYIDIYSYRTALDSADGFIEAVFDVDSEVRLVDLANSKNLRLFSSGPSESFDDIAWIDNDSFIIVGYNEAFKENGNRFYYAYIYHIDLKSKELREYRYPSYTIAELPDYYSVKYPEFVKERLCINKFRK